MKALQRISIVVLFFGAVPFFADGQNRYIYKPHNYINNIKLVGGIGTSTYFGDLCHGLNCASARPQLSAGAMLRLTPNISVRAEAAYIRLAGSDEGTRNEKRNLHFFSNNLEMTATVIYDFFQWNNIYARRAKYTPYAFVGIGGLLFGPRARYDGKTHALRKMQTEGQSYSPLTVIIPFGAGVRYSLTPFIDIGLEAGYRITFTDYLDDVSTHFVDNSSFSDPSAAALADRSHEGGFTPYGQSIDGRTAPEGTRRGNPNNNDGYFLFSIKLDYTIKITKQFYNARQHAPRFKSGIRHHHHRR